MSLTYVGSYYTKQIDSIHVAVRLFSSDNRIRQNVVKTFVTTLAIASCATFLFLPHMTSIEGKMESVCKIS